MQGVIIVDKPESFTSFDVVAKMRGMLHMKKLGHAGTLDPNATGVLPVFVGAATKLCDYLLCEEKCYIAELTLGRTTDTEDIWGEVREERSTADLTEEAVKEAILSFIGTYDQIPPMYSAKKVNGKKLYELARQGIEIERKPVRVCIQNIEILSVDLPKAEIRVTCSKGTYIRTLCTDIGEKLGTGACMSALRRVQHGQFLIENAVTLETLQRLADEGNAASVLIPIDRLFSDADALTCTEEGTKTLSNGNKLKPEFFIGLPEQFSEKPLFRIYNNEGKFKALYRYSEEESLFVPEKMFLTE